MFTAVIPEEKQTCAALSSVTWCPRLGENSHLGTKGSHSIILYEQDASKELKVALWWGETDTRRRSGQEEGWSEGRWAGWRYERGWTGDNEGLGNKKKKRCEGEGRNLMDFPSLPCSSLFLFPFLSFVFLLSGQSFSFYLPPLPSSLWHPSISFVVVDDVYYFSSLFELVSVAVLGLPPLPFLFFLSFCLIRRCMFIVLGRELFPLP